MTSLSYFFTLFQTILQGLMDKGHAVREHSSYLAVVGSIENRCPEECGDDCAQVKCVDAVSDGRKGGAPDGF